MGLFKIIERKNKDGSYFWYLLWSFKEFEKFMVVSKGDVVSEK